MIRHHIDIHGLDNLGRTLLHGASVNGQTEIVKLLIDAGLDVNAQGNRGETPLHDVACIGHDETANVLLEKGPDSSVTDHEGRTPLVVATQNGNSKVACILQGKGTAKETEGEYNDTRNELPVWAMAKLGLKQDIEKYIANGGDLYVRDNDVGDNALHKAAWARKSNIMGILLNAGMDANSGNNYKRTPLHMCALRGVLSGIRLLIKHNAKLDEKDMFGKTALVIAQEDCDFAVAVELIEAGAEIDIRAVPMQPTFFSAVLQGKVEAVKKLIDKGADLQARNYEGYTALQLAKENDHAEVIQILRQHKSFYIPSRTTSSRSEESPATSPPGMSESNTRAL